MGGVCFFKAMVTSGHPLFSRCPDVSFDLEMSGPHALRQKAVCLNFLK